jgi:anti-sigma factor RsiW
MKCDEVHPALAALFDDELEPADRKLVEGHLETCTQCRYELAELSSLRRILRSGPTLRAPESLTKAVIADLQGQRHGGRGFRHPWTAAAMACTVLIAIASLAFWSWRSYDDAGRLERHDVISAHARSLLGGSPVAIASSDRHVVKPWLTARVPYAPSVREPSAEGFVFLGARIDVIADRPVATLVYRRRQHLINLFVWPTREKATAEAEYADERGYGMYRWVAKGLVYYLVSDLDAAELRTLQLQACCGK